MTQRPENPLRSIWAGMRTRQALEMVLPGATVGLFGGVVAGGIAAIGGLSPGMALVAALALAVPLAIAGALYDMLVCTGRIPLGNLGPAALYWCVGFPAARAVHALLMDAIAGGVAPAPASLLAWADFLGMQLLVSCGFAIGFWYLHQNYAPSYWYRLRHRNPLAAYMMGTLLAFMSWQEEQIVEQRAARKAKRAGKREAKGSRRAARAGESGPS